MIVGGAMLQVHATGACTSARNKGMQRCHGTCVFHIYVEGATPITDRILYDETWQLSDLVGIINFSQCHEYRS
jgi:hypothetical protein